jgi:tetratricopeptide (TPR) repeat protein
MGIIYDSLKNFDKALMCYEECIKIDPNYSTAYNNIGWLYDTLKNDKEKAISYYKKAIEFDPNNTYARGNLANHNIVKKETAEDWNYEGIVYFKKKNYKEALKHFKKAKELKPEERLYWHNIGKAYHWLRKNKDAIKFFEKANSISPHFDTYLHMGYAYRNLKKLEKAMECLKEAEKLRSYNHDVINEIGIIFLRQGKIPQAHEYFLKTTELKPDFKKGWYNLGLTYKKLGEFYKAFHAWAKALSIDPNYHLAKKAAGTLLRERPYMKDDIIAVAEGKFDEYLKK